MKTAAKSENLKKDVVGENVVHLDRVKNTYSISIVNKEKLVKRWRIASHCVNKKKIGSLWYSYVVNEMEQSGRMGILAIPSSLVAMNSDDVQDVVQSILDRI